MTANSSAYYMIYVDTNRLCVTTIRLIRQRIVDKMTTTDRGKDLIYTHVVAVIGSLSTAAITLSHYVLW